MAVPQSVYKDLPLDESRREIRVLKFLEPQDSIISVSMLAISLDDPNIGYDALSYCWGEAIFDHDIICNEQLIKVTKGLFSALQRVQDLPDLNRETQIENACKALWVDQM
jgi:hypothetical protein